LIMKLKTVDDIMNLSAKGRIDEAAAELFSECLSQGAYTEDEIRKIAKERCAGKPLVFRGKPSRNYPVGRLYTGELIVREFQARGDHIEMSSAKARIRAAIKNPDKEERLFEDLNAFRSSKYRKIPKPALSVMNPTVRDEMSAVSKGKMSANEWLYGEESKSIWR